MKTQTKRLDQLEIDTVEVAISKHLAKAFELKHKREPTNDELAELVEDLGNAKAKPAEQRESVSEIVNRIFGGGQQ